MMDKRLLLLLLALVALLAHAAAIRVVLIPAMYPARMYPLRELGRELVSRGHDVHMFTYAATPPKLMPRADEHIELHLNEGRGAELVEQFEQLKRELNGADLFSWLETFMQYSGVSGREIALELAHYLKQLSPEERRNTVVVADDDHYASLLAADKYGVANAVFLPQLWHPYGSWDCSTLSWWDVPGSMTSFPALMGPARRAQSFVLSTVMQWYFGSKFIMPLKRNPAREALDMPPESFRFCEPPTRPVIVAAAPGLGVPVYPFPPHIIPTGPWISDSSLPPIPDHMKSFLDSHSVVLYVCYGTSVIMTEEQVHVAAQSIAHLITAHQVAVLWSLPEDRHQYLLTSPSGADGIEMHIESGALLVVSFTPQKSVLAHEHVRGFVSQCGSNSGTEGLFFGVPVLAMPYPNVDQELNARRIAEFGAGIVIEWGSEPSVHNVSSAMWEVLSSGALQSKAADASYYLKRSGGVRRASDVLEDLQRIGWRHLLTPTMIHPSPVVRYRLDVLCALSVPIGAITLLLRWCLGTKVLCFVIVPIVAATIFSGAL